MTHWRSGSGGSETLIYCACSICGWKAYRKPRGLDTPETPFGVCSQKHGDPAIACRGPMIRTHAREYPPATRRS